LNKGSIEAGVREKIAESSTSEYNTVPLPKQGSPIYAAEPDGRTMYLLLLLRYRTNSMVQAMTSGIIEQREGLKLQQQFLKKKSDIPFGEAYENMTVRLASKDRQSTSSAFEEVSRNEYVPRTQHRSFSKRTKTPNFTSRSGSVSTQLPTLHNQTDLQIKGSSRDNQPRMMPNHFRIKKH